MDNPNQPDFSKVPNTTGVEIREVAHGRVFVAGIHPNDVDQGLLGNCFFLAAIASIAQQNSPVIKRMIKENGNNTFTVSMYRRGWFGGLSPMEITVDGKFPVKVGTNTGGSSAASPKPTSTAAVDLSAAAPTKEDKPAFAGFGDQISSNTGTKHKEIWPMILEKAYAQMEGSYNHVIGGWPHHAMESLTGLRSKALTPKRVSFEEVAKYYEDGYAMSVYTVNDLRFSGIDVPDRTKHPRFKKNGGDLIAGHAYWVSGISREEKLIKIRNPWGWHTGEDLLNEADFQATMRGLSINPITA